MGLWSWDSASRRYRVTAEGAATLNQTAGTFIGQKKMLDFREQIIVSSKERVNGLSAQLGKGDINLNQWTLAMRQEIKDNFINQYMLAHGGRNTMSQADWGRVGQMVRNQYQYLDRFATDIAGGRYNESAVASRARMYAEASSQAFERSKVAARGMPDMPQYPGAGNTPCLSNCKCYWDIKENDKEWLCYWTLTPTENCAGCITNATTWNPLVVPKL